jgi:hypothetical protein
MNPAQPATLGFRRVIYDRGRQHGRFAEMTAHEFIASLIRTQPRFSDEVRYRLEPHDCLVEYGGRSIANCTARGLSARRQPTNSVRESTKQSGLPKGSRR